MSLTSLTDRLINPLYFNDIRDLRKARLIVRSSLLTSIFSTSYIALSWIVSFDKGVYFMIMNVVGFFLLAFTVKTNIKLDIIGNLYVVIGAIAVIALTYYSGGDQSYIYPWIISIPILAMLVVGRIAAFIWAGIALITMIGLSVLSANNYPFPVEYDTSYQLLLDITVMSGLLLILVVITYVFATLRKQAFDSLHASNLELKNQREQVSIKSDQLQQNIEDKDYLIQMLTHDISNSLNVISGSLDILNEDAEDETSIGLIKGARSSASTAQNLVRKTLEIGRLENSILNITLESHIVSDILQNSINHYQEAANSKSIRIVKHINTEDFALVDKTFLTQTFDNLISNAIKFSSKQSEIIISIKKVIDQLNISIVDEGPGIAPNEMKDLFKKYMKLTARPTSGESSTGLGLSLVKRYVEMMNGTISCYSEPGKGAKFIVTLPAVTLPNG
ncbi:MAG: HAMP domain-containing histidine kinase [Cyclobacteriaceae bacterium]